MSTPSPASRPSLPPGAATLPSHEFGLAMGLIFGRYFLDMRDLHYGYWPDDLAVEPRNLSQAQARYTEFLMSHIPEGVRSILDVGCGAGNTARKLLGRGYRVDCVSPNSFLTSVAREVLGDRATVFEAKFEDLETDRRYDLLLFSESFLFIKPDRGLPQASRLLTPRGHLLMTDIFKVPADDKSPIGGGHQLPVFREIMAGAPFELIRDVDMTPGIAPTFDLLDQAYAEVIKPAYDLLTARLAHRYPWLTRLARWKFRKTIERYEQKHFSGRRNAANFAKYKSYRLFLYRKRA